jgi:APA family basic amino acid/polyamine antiporter
VRTASAAPLTDLAFASALVFVAFTGYGRIATMGEEVVEPARTIPRAVAATLGVSAALYLGVAVVLIAALDGRSPDASFAAPLETAAMTLGVGWLSWPIAIGAMTAMLGVLLNLVLGLSRVALAMGRERDLPPGLARLSAQQQPIAAMVVVGVVVAGLTLLGDVRTAWSFSAATVLAYYAITNVAALRLPREQRRFPRWIAWAGLVGCVGLSAFVPWPTLAAAAGVVAVGFVVRAACRGLFTPAA